MNPKVSYGSLAPAMIGGLGVVMSTLFAKATRGESPVTLKSLPDVIEFSDSGIWGDESLGEETEPRIFRVSDFIGDFRLNFVSAPNRSISDKALQRFRLRNGDVLVVKSSGSANQVVSGRVAVFESPTQQAYAASNFLLRLRPSSGIDSHYLAFVLGSPPVREFVADSVKTMTYPNLSFRTYSRVVVPFIPLQDQKAVADFFFALLNNQQLPQLPAYLAEQWRVVARIKELAGKIEEAHRLREDAYEEAVVLPLAALGAYFRRLSEQFGRMPLGEILTDARYGSSEKCVAEKMEGGTPVLRIPNVTSEVVSLSDLKFARLGVTDRERLLLSAGDILVVRTNGSLSLVGRTAVVPTLPEDCAFASYLIRLRFDTKRVAPDFAQRMLQHLRVAGVLVDFARTTAGQYNVSLGRLRSAAIPVPPLPEQRRVVAELDALQAQTDALKSLQAETTAELDALLPAILDRAFKGELV